MNSKISAKIISLSGLVIFIYNVTFSPFSINFLGILGGVLLAIGLLFRYSILYKESRNFNNKKKSFFIYFLLYGLVLFLIFLFS